jgi:hypothetical protein
MLSNFKQMVFLLTYVVAASVQIYCTSSDKGGFGHPEENHNQSDPKSTTHSVESRFVAAILYDISSFMSQISEGKALRVRRLTNRLSQIDAAQDSQIENRRSIPTLMNKPGKN